MTYEWNINIVLKKDRYQEGILHFTILENSSEIKTPVFQHTCACRGQGNYTHRPKSIPWHIRNGDTPTGAAKGLVIQPGKNKVAYGPHKRIDISREPISGNLLKAIQVYKRSGLQIHGGRDNGGRLWNTSGCIRVHDDDMKYIVDMIESKCGSEGIVTIEER